MAYKLTYFNMRGRAECIRMIFAAAGTKYEDNRIASEDWPAVKASTPWGQIPILEVGDKTLAQTITICRYLGHQLKLSGKDSWEAAKCDEYVDAVNDLFNEWVKYFFEKDPDKKIKAHADFKSVPLPKYLSKFNDIQSKVDGPYLIGKDLTWADIFIADKLNRLQETEGPDVLDPYPNLKAFKEAVHAVPNIKAYVSQRPPK
ncbi:glutathione S-transferase 1 [Folsomia candida]|uniref:glutathione transferase n=1 Tax=Folsomia candida TaxID=158441 RepID=A0A226E3P7_FOLCA|nr:glutathione S-transferase 1 [Folsomia candida]OXA52352.1 Glutathione S-transferase 1 [Folsomia candida]